MEGLHWEGNGSHGRVLSRSVAGSDSGFSKTDLGVENGFEGVGEVQGDATRGGRNWGWPRDREPWHWRGQKSQALGLLSCGEREGVFSPADPASPSQPCLSFPGPLPFPWWPPMGSFPVPWSRASKRPTHQSWKEFVNLCRHELHFADGNTEAS